MKRNELDGVTFTEVVPFGLIVGAVEPASDLRTAAAEILAELTAAHRVVILRGFAPLAGDEFPQFCRRLGDLQEWDFGVVNNLRVDPQAENYLYTNRAVPFHWDGA